MNKQFSFILTTASLIFFICYIIFSIIKYNSICQKKYSIKDDFPFLLNIEGNFITNFSGNLCLILSTCFGVAFYTTSTTYEFRYGWFICIIVLGILSELSICFVANFGLKNYQAHALFLTLSSIFGLLLNISIIFEAAKLISFFEENLYLIPIILSSIFLLIYFYIVLNPEFSFKKIVSYDQSGNIINSKGKLPFFEWLTLFLNELSKIILIVLIILT